jgi:uncharacterized membrane protein
MKKYFVFTVVSVAALIFANCGSSKKATATVVPKLNFEANMQAVVVANCSPCHIPAKGGNKKPYDNFANVKTDIDEIIRRIELEPSARGFMPFRKNAKLSDSTIAVFKQWKADGLLEK